VVAPRRGPSLNLVRVESPKQREDPEGSGEKKKTKGHSQPTGAPWSSIFQRGTRGPGNTDHSLQSGVGHESFVGNCTKEAEREKEMGGDTGVG